MTDRPHANPLTVRDRWCVHGYYTLCPYAPDGSGRLLVAGADLEQSRAEVIVLSANGETLDRFGSVDVTGMPSFWHTGLWQSWSPDARHVYYQSGSLQRPTVTRRELATGEQITVDGDLEGIPPSGEPGISCSHGLLYAAGYGGGDYDPSRAPVPFQARDRHGISQLDFDPPAEGLVMSTQQILDDHPDRRRLMEADEQMRRRLGPNDGLTLMTYCVRWNPAGTRFLFYFGNHTVASKTSRGEPRIGYVFTADRALSEIRLAVDLSFGRRGVHWGWHPDNEHLIGYGPDPAEPGSTCIAQVRYDGTDYRRLYPHHGGGHPSICPSRYNLLVTDTGTNPGKVLFIDTDAQGVLAEWTLPRVFGQTEPPGRNPHRVCHHPVFDPTGRKVLINTLPGRHAGVAEIMAPEISAS